MHLFGKKPFKKLLTQEEKNEKFIQASGRGNVKEIENLLNQGADVNAVDAKNSKGDTALHWACRSGNFDVVSLLLQHGAATTRTNKQDETPVQLARSNGTAGVVHLLESQSSKHDTFDLPQKFSFKDTSENQDEQMRQFKEALQSGDKALVEQLLASGVDANTEFQDINALEIKAQQDHMESKGMAVIGTPSYNDDGSCVVGGNPLCSACSDGHLEVVRVLLKHGANADFSSSEGLTPLHAACSKNHLEVAQLLLENGASMSPTNTEGQTPLDKACSNGHEHIVSFLLDKGAEINPSNKKGLTPLHLASKNGKDIVAHLLIGRGAVVNATSISGNSPLYEASFRGHTKVVRLLIEHGASLDSRNNFGQTALDEACYRGRFEIAQLLIEAGATVNVKNAFGHTPLHSATRSVRGGIEIVAMLLDNGSDLMSRDKDGRVPLHEATSDGRLETARLLLDRGSDVNAAMVDGNTPLHMASESGQSEIVRLFLDYGAHTDVVNADGKTPLDLAQIKTVVDLLEKNQNVAQNKRSEKAESKAYAATAEIRSGFEKKAPSRQTRREPRDPDGQRWSVRNDLGTLQNGVAMPEAGNLHVVDEGIELGAPAANVQVGTAGAFGTDSTATAAVCLKVQAEGNERIARVQSMVEAARASPSSESEAMAILAKHFDHLYALAVQKEQTDDDDMERRAIFASLEHREFYCMLLNQVDCAVTACKSLASGMVQHSSQASFRTWFASLVTERSAEAVLRHTPVGKLVRDSIKWAAKQVPLPFVESFATLFHALFSVNAEREKYLAVARVAEFAVIAEEMGGLQTMLARLSRCMVRSDRFVGKKPDFAGWQKWSLQMLGEPSTRSQAQGSLVAEQIVHCIMAPSVDCPVRMILEGEDNRTSLDVALASVVLDLPVEEVKALPPFFVDNSCPPPPTGDLFPDELSPAPDLGPVTDHATSKQSAHPSRERGSSTAEFKELICRMDKFEKENQALKFETQRLKDHIRHATDKDGPRNNVVDGGDGLLQVYAGDEQKYEGRLETLEKSVEEIKQFLAALGNDQAVVRETTENKLHGLEDEISTIKSRKKKAGIGKLFNRKGVGP